MNISFNHGGSFDAAIRGERTVSIDLAQMPENALVAIFEYGMQRIINDACGRAGKEDAVNEEGVKLYATREAWLDACESIALKKRDALYKGDVGRVAAEPKNPLDAMILKIASADLLKAIKKAGFSSAKAFDAKPEHGKGTFDARLAEYVAEARDALTARAKTQMAEESAAVSAIKI